MYNIRITPFKFQYNYIKKSSSPHITQIYVLFSTYLHTFFIRKHCGNIICTYESSTYEYIDVPFSTNSENVPATSPFLIWRPPSHTLYGRFPLPCKQKSKLYIFLKGSQLACQAQTYFPVLKMQFRFFNCHCYLQIWFNLVFCVH